MQVGGDEARPWGFKATIEAPVSPAFAELLATEPDHTGYGTWKLKWAQLALCEFSRSFITSPCAQLVTECSPAAAACDNNIDAARAYLIANAGMLAAQDAAADDGACMLHSLACFPVAVLHHCIG